MATSKTRKIGKYEILDVLGKGGMGVVYKAVDPSIGRLVAIKMITGNYAEDANFLKRFYREAQSNGKLQHPNIVSVYDLGDYEGNPFLVMEFLEGESLDAIIRSQRALPLVDKLDLMMQVCNGLQYAHHRNVIHRDIKPANLMVLKGGQVKIVDFGIARIEDDSNVTMPSQVIGTIQYMSPEQINGKQVDGRSDVFSTAVVLYQLLTGHLPFDGEDTGATLLKIINDPPPLLSEYLQSYPPELDNVVQRALAKSRDERYQTAEELAFDLGQVQEQLRREAAAEYLRGAEAALERGELNRAREQCLEILRFDRQEVRARQLLQRVQQQMQKQQRSEQAQQLRSQAQEAMAAEELDRALLYLCQAVDLDPQNAELLSFREAVRDAKARADQRREAMSRAQSAHYAGDLTEALQAVECALTLDSSDTEAQALRAEITHEIAQRKRQAEIRGLVEEAQRQISARRFTAALEALQKAETLDPAAPGLRELMTLAASGREQELRRKELERFSSAITDALNHDDYAAACQRADEALARFPDDRGLGKLKSMAERRRQAAEKRQFIEEQISSARKLLDEKQTETALRNLEAAYARFPNEPALMSVLTIVKQTLEQEKREARKNEVIGKAKEALRRKEFVEAIAVLEASCAEFDSPELEDMLQFAREQAAAFEREQRVEAAVAEAERLMSAAEYEQAITFLRATLAAVPDEDLEIILADAERHVEDFNRQVNEAIETAERLLRLDRVSEAVRFVESQPQEWGKSARFREVGARAHECQERLRRISATVEKARAALAAREWQQALDAIQECRASTGDHPELARLAAQITADRTQAAVAAVTKATNDCRMLFLGRSYDAAQRMLDGVSAMVEHVPDDLRARYTLMHEEAERGILRRQQEAELARAQSDLSTRVEDTAERTSWAIEPTTRQATDSHALRRKDIEELTQLSHDAETTATLDELAAISARARVLAARHDEDGELQSMAAQVVSSANARVESATELVGRAPAQSFAERVEVQEPVSAVERVVALPIPPEPLVPMPVASAAALPEEPPAVGSGEVAAPVPEVSGPISVEPAPPVADSVPPPEAAASLETGPPAEASFDEQSLTTVQPVPVRTPVELPLAAGAENAPVLPPPPVFRGAPPADIGVRPKPAARPESHAPRSGAGQVRSPIHVEPHRPPAPARKFNVATVASVAAALLLIVAAIVWELRPSPAKTTGTTGHFLVVSSTPEGAVVQVTDRTCVTPNCRLDLSPGDYEIKAFLAGYKSESREVHIPAGSAPPTVSFMLEPLPTRLRISTNLSEGDVALDGRPAGALRQGQLELPQISPGQHKLKVSSGGNSAEVNFTAATARAPEIQGPVNANGVAALAVSTLVPRAVLDCNCDDTASLSIDGRSAGQFKAGRQDVQDLSAGAHELLISSGRGTRTHMVQVSAAPVLDVFVDGNSDLGVLVVQAGLGDASVYVDGRKAGTTGTDGTYRAPLPPRHVTVRVSKAGYKSAPEQTAELRGGGETALTFELQPISDKSTLVVAGGPPNTSVSVDGRNIGSLSTAGEFTGDIAVGNHTIGFAKDGFESKKVNLSFTAGQTVKLAADLPRSQPPAAKEVTSSPKPPPLELPPAVAPQPAAPAAPSADQQDWQRTRDSNDPAILQAFLSRYPNSSFAAEAKDRLRQLQLTSDRNSVLQTLKRYADAYQHKNADELQAVWPALDKQDRKKISDSFKSAKEIQVDLKPSGDPSISGDTATVTCDRSLLYTFAGGEQKTFSDRVTIRLRKKSGAWLIEQVS